MPLIILRTSLSEIEGAEELLKELSKQLSILTSKPEKYVMTILEKNLQMTFSGNNDPCCYVEIKSIGSLKPKIMSEVISSIISKKTKIAIDRIYINFEDIEASKWGFNGATFA
tara:strand:+ start:129 stop:467 length:339 start_codon:yes stop_codon:yes gene_type:complete